MNFWNKMLSNITDTVLPKKLDDDTLFLQIEEALQEEKNLWNSQQSYIDPYTVKSFQDK